MSAGESKELLRIAEQVSDGRQVDWDTEERMRPQLTETLRWLRQIETLMRTHGEIGLDAEETADATSRTALDGDTVVVGTTVTEPLPLEHWGPLRILGVIGGGAFGVVCRAFDPALQQEVALKLWRRSGDAGEDRLDEFLAEARRLARVRHENVLVVHGADWHEGRAGMWTDLVRGETLEQRLERDGVLGQHEAAQIGIELCRALAAVHGAGLIHRDVKTSNVMRTEEGRYVLMDFGTVGETSETGALDASMTMRGTPITMALEQLTLGRITPATDIYGLGVLLYRLVTGCYPIEADDLYALAEKHRRREAIPLTDRRPDLSAKFVCAIEKALDPDPQRRHASAGAMERALLEALQQPEASPGPEDVTSSARRPVLPRVPWYRRWQVVGGAAAVVVALVVVFGRKQPPAPSPEPVKPPLVQSEDIGGTGPAAEGRSPADTPIPAAETRPPTAAPFTVQAQLLRATANGAERLSPGASITAGDALFLEIGGNKSMYVYVLTEDASGRAVVLYGTSEKQNPLAAGATHRLPDPAHGWGVDSTAGTETMAIIASTQRQTGLEAELTRLRDISGTVLLPRGIDAALERLPPSGADPWVWRITLEHRGMP